MKYVGLQQQIRRNNRKSVLLLIAFPALLLASIFAVVFFMTFDSDGNPDPDTAVGLFLAVAPLVIVAVLIWFFIAYFAHSKMIALATGAKPLERKENLRVYNLVENLCMSVGMSMPKVEIIESRALNAYASGLKKRITPLLSPEAS